MSEKITFIGEIKEKSGKGVARQVRREGRIPAIIYGGNQSDAPIMLSLSQNEFNRVYQRGRLKSKLVEVILNGKPVLVIPREIETHPVTDNPMHVDFQRIVTGSLIKAEIPVKLTNEDKCIGVKSGGVLNIVHHSISLMCPAEKLPEFITIDVGTLDIGASIHINDIQLPEGAKPLERSNFTIVSVSGRSQDEGEAGAEAAESAAS
jgi:large subunit ribosomal protein L25